MIAPIFHITKHDEWERAKALGEYRAPSLTSQGFIHCSFAQQLVEVANFNFRGEKRLVLLEIDRAKLRSSVKYEGANIDHESFPHVYGPINLDAVSQIHDFPCQSNGHFDLPQTVKPIVFFIVRDFTPTDYDAISEVLNTTWPRRNISSSTLQSLDQEFGNYFSKRWVAETEIDGRPQIIGVGSVSESPWFLNTGTYAVNISVLPSFRNHGIGTALYLRCIDSLSSINPKTLHSRTPLDDPDGLSFLIDRDFFIHNKRYFLALELGTKSSQALIDSIPSELSRLQNLGVRTEIIGYSGISAEVNARIASIKMTGIRRQWRGKGIARVLKLCLIKAARDLGFQEIETANDETNAPILALNRKLGFLEKSGIIELKKDWNSR